MVDVVESGLGFMPDLLDLLLDALGAHEDFFCVVEGVHEWHLKVDFLALRAVRPAHCVCDQKPVSHWTIIIGAIVSKGTTFAFHLGVAAVVIILDGEACSVSPLVDSMSKGTGAYTVAAMGGRCSNAGWGCSAEGEGAGGSRFESYSGSSFQRVWDMTLGEAVG